MYDFIYSLISKVRANYRKLISGVLAYYVYIVGKGILKIII